MKQETTFEYEKPALDVFEYGNLVIARGGSGGGTEIKDKDKDFGDDDEF